MLNPNYPSNVTLLGSIGVEVRLLVDTTPGQLVVMNEGKVQLLTPEYRA